MSSLFGLYMPHCLQLKKFGALYTEYCDFSEMDLQRRICDKLQKN